MNVVFCLGWRSAWTGSDESTANVSADLCDDGATSLSGGTRAASEWSPGLGVRLCLILCWRERKPRPQRRSIRALMRAISSSALERKNLRRGDVLVLWYPRTRSIEGAFQRGSADHRLGEGIAGKIGQQRSDDVSPISDGAVRFSRSGQQPALGRGGYLLLLCIIGVQGRLRDRGFPPAIFRRRQQSRQGLAA